MPSCPCPAAHATPHPRPAALQPISEVRFPSQRYGHRAVQAVHVVAQQQQQGQQRDGGSVGATPPPSQQQQEEEHSPQQQQRLRGYAFTFCMERVEEGAFKGCWLTTGVRVGDYSV